MTPKEKAIELHNKILNITYDDRDIPGEPTWVSTKCALIAVDELIESFDSIYDASISNIEKYSGEKYGMQDYWADVKQEIEKL